MFFLFVFEYAFLKTKSVLSRTYNIWQYTLLPTYLPTTRYCVRMDIYKCIYIYIYIYMYLWNHFYLGILWTHLPAHVSCACWLAILAWCARLLHLLHLLALPACVLAVLACCTCCACSLCLLSSTCLRWLLNAVLSCRACCDRMLATPAGKCTESWLRRIGPLQEAETFVAHRIETIWTTAK